MFECPIAWVPKCSSSALIGVRLEWPWNKKVCNIIGNGISHSFKEFSKNFLEYKICIGLLLTDFLETEFEIFIMFSKPVIITWCSQKLSLNIFLKFQRMKYDGLPSTLFRKITELQWYYLVLLFQLYNNQIFSNIFVNYFLPAKACFV